MASITQNSELTEAEESQPEPQLEDEPAAADDPESGAPKKKPGKQRARKDELKKRRKEFPKAGIEDDTILDHKDVPGGTNIAENDIGEFEFMTTHRSDEEPMVVTEDEILRRNRLVERRSRKTETSAPDVAKKAQEKFDKQARGESPDPKDPPTRGPLGEPSMVPFPVLDVTGTTYSWDTCWEMGLEGASYATDGEEAKHGLFDFVLDVLGLSRETTDVSVATGKEAKNVDARTKSAKRRGKEKAELLERGLAPQEREPLDDGTAEDAPLAVEETEEDKKNPRREVPKGTAPTVKQPLVKLRALSQAARMDIRRPFEDPRAKDKVKDVCFFKVSEGLNVLDPMMLERQFVKMPHYTVFDVLGYLMGVAASGWEAADNPDEYHLALLSLYCHWTRKLAWTLLGKYILDLKFDSLATETIPAMHSSMWTESGHLVLGSSIPGGSGMKKPSPPKNGDTGGGKPDDGPGKPGKGKDKPTASDKEPKAKPSTKGGTIGTDEAGPSNQDKGKGKEQAREPTTSSDRPGPPTNGDRQTKRSNQTADQALADEGQATRKKKAKSVGQNPSPEPSGSRVSSAKTKAKKVKSDSAEDGISADVVEPRPRRKSKKVNGNSVGEGVDEELAEPRPKKKKSQKVNGDGVEAAIDGELEESRPKKKKSQGPVPEDGVGVLPERPRRSPDTLLARDGGEPPDGASAPKKTKKKSRPDLTEELDADVARPKKGARKAQDGAIEDEGALGSEPAKPRRSKKNAGATSDDRVTAREGLSRPRARRLKAPDDDAANDAPPARERTSRTQSARRSEARAADAADDAPPIREKFTRTKSAGGKGARDSEQNAADQVAAQTAPKREETPTFGKKNTTVKDEIQEDRATKILSVGDVKGKTLDLASATAYPTKHTGSGDLERAAGQLFGHCAESNEFVWLAKGSEWTSGQVSGLAMNPRALAFKKYVPEAYAAQLQNPCPNCTEMLMQIVGNQDGKEEKSAQQTVLKHFGVAAFMNRAEDASVKDRSIGLSTQQQRQATAIDSH